MCEIHIRITNFHVHVKSGSARRGRIRLRHKFRDVTVPQRETVHRTANKL
jgi:hypothetical protein